MAKSNKAIYWLGGIFLVLMILDLATTLSLRNLIQYLESNPTYQYVGIGGIAVFNALFIIGMFIWYKKTNKISTRYMVIAVLVSSCVSRLLVIWNNFEVSAAPPTLEVAQAVTSAMRWEAVIEYAFISFMPYIIVMLTYLFFTMDHKVEVKHEHSN